jgi:hypothetical protein
VPYRRLLGILLTKVDHCHKGTGEIVGVIRDHYNDQVFRAEGEVVSS